METCGKIQLKAVRYCTRMGKVDEIEIFIQIGPFEQLSTLIIRYSVGIICRKK